MYPHHAKRQNVPVIRSKRRDFVTELEARLKNVGSWSDWTRMPTWTADEAAALVLGLSPMAVVSYQQMQHPAIERYRIIREMIRRACMSEDLPHRDGAISPREFLKWAVYYNLQAPSHLIAAVSSAPESPGKLSQDRPIGSRERDTLLRLIAGLAVGGYGYDPSAKKSSTVKEIHDDLALRGITLDQDTIRGKLKEAAQLVGQFSSLAEG